MDGTEEREKVVPKCRNSRGAEAFEVCFFDQQNARGMWREEENGTSRGERSGLR